MVKHVIDKIRNGGLGAQNIHLVYGHGGDQMKATLAEWIGKLSTASRAGWSTGHAVDQASAHFAGWWESSGTLRWCSAYLAWNHWKPIRRSTKWWHRTTYCCADNPMGYGRIIRRNGP